MKTYIGTKTVKAKPCNLGDFINLTGRNPYANSDDVHGMNEEGYLVEYPDGYKSWSPKAVFEAAYKCAESFTDRLEIEIKEASDRFVKLVSFIDFNDTFNQLDNKAQTLLHIQREAMGRYIQVLSMRTDYIKNNEEVVIPNMGFGIAILALKQGLAIRRKGWNGKNIYVVKQVPQSIPSDIIPKMNSLPQSAKDKILAGVGHIDYTSQCLIINETTGRADSWVPSISDVFADDWEIYW